MPTVTSVIGDVYEVDEVVVNAARLNFFTTTPSGGGGGGGGGLEGEAPTIGEGDPPENPDGFMPEPQSCADIRYLLRDYESKRDHYAALNSVIESVGLVSDFKDILEVGAAAAAIAGISSMSQRAIAIKALFESLVPQIVARLGVSSLAPLTVGAGILYLTNLGTKGRWDARIAALNAKKQDWNCD